MTMAPASSSEEVEDLKRQANALFTSGSYLEAIILYSKAIDAAPDNAVLYSNRSAASLRLGRGEEARSDALRCIALRPEWEKGHYRLGAVCEQAGEWEEAIKAYQRCLDLSPATSNTEIARKVKALKQQHQTKKEKKAPLGANVFSCFSEGREEERGAGAGDDGRDSGATAGLGGHAGGTTEEGVNGDIDPVAWARGLSTAKRYEWLIDCYRLRVSDDARWGNYVHGLYAATARGPGTYTRVNVILPDLLLFCKLAVRAKVIPLDEGWEWSEFLALAERTVCQAFEKQDAKRKYGSENIFSAFMGKRSLRYTALQVYGCSMQEGGLLPAEEALRREIVDTEWWDLGPEVFEEVGGEELWRLMNIP